MMIAAIEELLYRISLKGLFCLIRYAIDFTPRMDYFDKSRETKSNRAIWSKMQHYVDKSDLRRCLIRRYVSQGNMA